MILINYLVISRRYAARATFYKLGRAKTLWQADVDTSLNSA